VDIQSPEFLNVGCRFFHDSEGVCDELPLVRFSNIPTDAQHKYQAKFYCLSACHLTLTIVLQPFEGLIRFQKGLAQFEVLVRVDNFLWRLLAESAYLVS
jgi:hypothetical protein